MMMRYLLHATLLLWCASGCLAAESRQCMFDEIRRKDGAQPLAVVREVPHKDQSGWQAYTLSGGEKTWAPIRINVSTEDMNNPAKYCTRVGDVRPDFMGGTLVCESENILTDEKRKLLVEQTIPAAVKLHTDRLSVKPVTTSVVVEPLKGSVCSHFTVPKGHGTSGVSGADMIWCVSVCCFGPLVLLKNGCSHGCSHMKFVFCKGCGNS
ncbi:surface protease GP63 [Trypanosoma grayi]|uniref:surface protease GP63 n=1 Tax=Trypanosoma grayi TaxID=71804 RepID=UPI0004F431F8|nr:surface protease GP63 [Trypanosoma grayi]KEG13131.1 surface protease GP63 [Trypanosoma grayi]